MTYCLTNMSTESSDLSTDNSDYECTKVKAISFFFVFPFASPKRVPPELVIHLRPEILHLVARMRPTGGTKEETQKERLKKQQLIGTCMCCMCSGLDSPCQMK